MILYFADGNANTKFQQLTHILQVQTPLQPLLGRVLASRLGGFGLREVQSQPQCQTAIRKLIRIGKPGSAKAEGAIQSGESAP